MLNTPILDLAITLSFTYFMLSLIVSALNEFVYSIISRRGKMLKEAINNLIFDKGEWKDYAENKIFTSPQIQSLQRSINKFPSYIPAKNFSTAILESIRTNGQLLDMNGVRNLLLNNTTPPSNAIPDSLKNVLIPLFEKAQGDMQKFQGEIESFYNSAMDRVTGWYKRETSNVIFVIAFVICIIGNIDTVNIITTLWGNPQKLSEVATNITNVTKSIQYDKDSSLFSYKQNGSLNDKSFNGISSSYEITQMDTAKNVQRKVTVNLDNASKAGKTLSSTGIPIGWGSENESTGECSSACFWKQLAGWLITAIAVMLGAPFWFDLLNKFISLRGSGSKPDTNPSPIKAGSSGNGTNSQTQNAVG